MGLISLLLSFFSFFFSISVSFLFACLPFIFSFSFPIGFIMFACTRGYISLVQWHYFKNCQWWHDALHNVFKNRRHTLPIYLTVVSINYLTKNTFTTDGFQSYEENRRLLLLIYAVILKLSTFLRVYTILEINCSLIVIFDLFY